MEYQEYEVYEFKERYKDINVVLYWLVEQAKLGVDYCRDNFPAFDNPIDLYNYLKARVRFKNDQTGVEQIQHPFTLFENNLHGIPGAGDCDCFVTLLLSALWANDMYENYILLYGKRRSAPSHISCATVWNGEFIYLDLTEPRANKERYYPLYQELPVF